MRDTTHILQIGPALHWGSQPAVLLLRFLSLSLFLRKLIAQATPRTALGSAHIALEWQTRH